MLPMSTGFPFGNIILTNFVNIYTKWGKAFKKLWLQAQGLARSFSYYDENGRILVICRHFDRLCR